MTLPCLDLGGSFTIVNPFVESFASKPAPLKQRRVEYSFVPSANKL